MIVYEVTGTEQHPVYKKLEYFNSDRQLHFLESMVDAALEAQRRFLSQTLIKALNFHAIACLHVNAGEYRPCPVEVDAFLPPAHYRVGALMDDFVNDVNLHWNETDPFLLSAFVLWKLNYIHPFINGNGRTARACCYFVLCVKAGGWISGNPILPELLRQHRNRYVAALQHADDSLDQQAAIEDALGPLSELIRELLAVQIASA